MFTEAQQVPGLASTPPASASPRARAAVSGDLIAHREQRVERRHGVLEDHGHALAADARASRSRTCEESPRPRTVWSRLAMRAAGGSSRIRREAPESSCPSRTRRRCRGSSRLERERDVVHRARHAGCRARSRTGWTAPTTSRRTAHNWRSCGSNLTRSQSPRRLAESTMSMMQMPGSTVSHQ